VMNKKQTRGGPAGGVEWICSRERQEDQDRAVTATRGALGETGFAGDGQRERHFRWRRRSPRCWRCRSSDPSAVVVEYRQRLSCVTRLTIPRTVSWDTFSSRVTTRSPSRRTRAGTDDQ
jgi:hypothetical protein